MNISLKYFFYTAVFTVVLSGCGKDWLDEKTDKKLVIPSTLDDLQTLLNNGITGTTPLRMADVACGEYTLPDNTWSALTNPDQKNSYIWKPDYVSSTRSIDWTQSYQSVFYCNVVLDELRKIERTSTNATQWDNIKGGALMIRSKEFYSLVQQYSRAYNNSTAETDLGIPLRLSALVDDKTFRSSMKTTYEQIIGDLMNAAPLLPIIPQNKTLPSRPAAFAYLAKTYLAMQIYEKAGIYADSTLNLYSTLIDYNSLNTASSFPIGNFNSEVIYNGALSSSAAASAAIIPLTTYNLYADRDLRKKAYFNANNASQIRFKGSYSGSSILFSGIATDELYLIRAECRARTNKVNEALSDLNTLLEKRWQRNFFEPISATNADDALQKILLERYKELLRRGSRWSDLKRLNKEARFATTLSRTIAGTTYTLPPNDPRYAIPIPTDILQLSGIQQNQY